MPAEEPLPGQAPHIDDACYCLVSIGVSEIPTWFFVLGSGCEIRGGEASVNYLAGCALVGDRAGRYCSSYNGKGHACLGLASRAVRAQPPRPKGGPVVVAEDRFLSPQRCKKSPSSKKLTRTPEGLCPRKKTAYQQRSTRKQPGVGLPVFEGEGQQLEKL